MSEIILIRTFDRPVGPDYFDKATAALTWCRKLYGVSPRIHFLADDGLRCACVFGAPDAEAVRNVIRAGDRAEPAALWPSTVHPGPEDDGGKNALDGGVTRTLVLVERSFAHPARVDELHLDGAPDDPKGLHFVRSYLSSDRLWAICLYTAPDLESVQQAHRTAGLTFERMWRARVIQGAASEAKALVS